MREIRQRQNIPQREELEFAVRCERQRPSCLQPMQPYFTQMANAKATADWGPTRRAAGSYRLVERLPASRDDRSPCRREPLYRRGAERKRLEKERENLAKQIGSIDAQAHEQGVCR